MTSTDTTLRAADAVFVAEQAVGRARRVVEELQTTVASALRVLDDAELDSARRGSPTAVTSTSGRLASTWVDSRPAATTCRS